MTITEINRSTLALVQADLKAAFAAVATNHGLKIDFNGGKFSKLGADLKLKVQVVDTAGAAAADRAKFAACAPMWGLAASDFGRQFMSQGKLYRITGVAPGASRFPILAERVWDKRGFKFPVSTVKTGFTAMPAAPATVAA